MRSAHVETSGTAEARVTATGMQTRFGRIAALAQRTRRERSPLERELDRVTRIVKIVGFVASDTAFTGQPGVVNGASELLGEVFGEAGRHARSAVGVAVLPLDAPVEIELIVEFA